MINYNSELVSSSNAVLNSSNRGFKFGDALFETFKVEQLKVTFLEDHYFRLMASMRMLRMEIPMDFTMDFLEKELLKSAMANNLDDARLRLTVFRKDGGLYNPLSNEIDFIIEASPLEINLKSTYTIDLFKDYFVYSGLLSTIKTTNKITNVLASIYAAENEFDNCILLNEKKQVVETINGNIFLVKGDTIKTPPVTSGCVKGIIRKKLIEFISKNPNYSMEEGDISPFDLQKADELFLTNVIIGIQPITNYKKAVFKTNIGLELRDELKGLV